MPQKITSSKTRVYWVCIGSVLVHRPRRLPNTEPMQNQYMGYFGSVHCYLFPLSQHTLTFTQCRFNISSISNVRPRLTLRRFKFSVTWSCVSLPRSTTTSDWKFVWFTKLISHHISVFQDLKHILLLTTDYTGANKTQNVYCSRHQCPKGWNHIGWIYRACCFVFLFWYHSSGFFLSERTVPRVMTVMVKWRLYPLI